MIRARVEPKLKREAEKVLRELGLGASEAISLYYAQIAHRRALPFAVTLDMPSVPVPHSPVPSGTFTDLASLYKRLDELDEWRRFSYDLSHMKLRP